MERAPILSGGRRATTTSVEYGLTATSCPGLLSVAKAKNPSTGTLIHSCLLSIQTVKATQRGLRWKSLWIHLCGRLTSKPSSDSVKSPLLKVALLERGTPSSRFCTAVLCCLFKPAVQCELFFKGKELKKKIKVLFTRTDLTC